MFNYLKSQLDSYQANSYYHFGEKNVPRFDYYVAHSDQYGPVQLWTCNVSVMVVVVNGGEKIHFGWRSIDCIKVRHRKHLTLVMVGGEKVTFRFQTKLQRKCFLFDCIHEDYIQPHFNKLVLSKFVTKQTPPPGTTTNPKIGPNQVEQAKLRQQHLKVLKQFLGIESQSRSVV